MFLSAIKLNALVPNIIVCIFIDILKIIIDISKDNYCYDYHKQSHIMKKSFYSVTGAVISYS